MTYLGLHQLAAGTYRDSDHPIPPRGFESQDTLVGHFGDPGGLMLGVNELIPNGTDRAPRRVIPAAYRPGNVGRAVAKDDPSSRGSTANIVANILVSFTV